METFYAFCGIPVILAIITMIGDPNKYLEVINKTKDFDINEHGAVGCSALFAYVWFLIGLFTSQWFLCAAFIALGAVEMMFKKLFSIKTTIPGIYIGGALDVLFVLAIIINSQWLHIDLYEKFINLF